MARQKICEFGEEMLPRTQRQPRHLSLIRPFLLCACLLVRDKSSQGVRSSTLAASGDPWVNLLKHWHTSRIKRTHTTIIDLVVYSLGLHSEPKVIYHFPEHHTQICLCMHIKMHNHHSSLYISSDNSLLCTNGGPLENKNGKRTTFILNFVSETPALSSPRSPSLI